MEFRFAYDLSSASSVKVWVPKGINWNNLKDAGLKPQYAGLILSQVAYRLGTTASEVDSYVHLNSKCLEKLHNKYYLYMDWFIEQGILQVNKSYRASGKGRHFSKSYRFAPAFIENAGGWSLATVSDKRAVRAFKNFIAQWDATPEEVSNSVELSETTNIKDNNTNISKEYTNIEALYVRSFEPELEQERSHTPSGDSNPSTQPVVYNSATRQSVYQTNVSTTVNYGSLDTYTFDLEAYLKTYEEQ